MRLLTPLLLILFTLTTLAIKAPTSYCKCICFQNSTIIPLNSPPDTSTSSPRNEILHLRDDDAATTDADKGGKKHHTLTCNDCNRAFCLDYNLPICKNAKEEDVFATCFRMFPSPVKHLNHANYPTHRTRLPQRPHNSNDISPRNRRPIILGTPQAIRGNIIDVWVGTEIWGSYGIEYRRGK